MTRREVIAEMRSRPYDRVDFNCWHLVGFVLKNLRGLDVPSVSPGLVDDPKSRACEIRTHPYRGLWSQVDKPEDLDIVLMGRTPGLETHVGVWLGDDGGLVLHNDERHGTVLDTVVQLTAVRRWCLSYFNFVGAQ